MHRWPGPFRKHAVLHLAHFVWVCGHDLCRRSLCPRPCPKCNRMMCVDWTFMNVRDRETHHDRDEFVQRSKRLQREIFALERCEAPRGERRHALRASSNCTRCENAERKSGAGVGTRRNATDARARDVARWGTRSVAARPPVRLPSHDPWILLLPKMSDIRIAHPNTVGQKKPK